MSVDVTKDGPDWNYYDGYDDGFGGYNRRCQDSEYLEGYYDGLKDSGSGRVAGYDYDDYWD